MGVESGGEEFTEVADALESVMDLSSWSMGEDDMWGMMNRGLHGSWWYIYTQALDIVTNVHSVGTSTTLYQNL